MARKDPKRKSNCEGRSETRHRELRPEVEAIARDLLAEISPFSVADDVENTLLQYDYDDLNSRAGCHSWGYVEPTEAAWELLDEAVEPFVRWVPDFPEEEAGNALQAWMSAAGAGEEGETGRRKSRALEL